MSVRTELEELVEWISDLTAAEEEDKPPPVVAREVWQDVRDDLYEVAERFAFARDLLLAKNSKSVLAEFAGDLQREARSLGLRAHMLSRRAPLRSELKSKEEEAGGGTPAAAQEGVDKPQSEAERKAEEERTAEENLSAEEKRKAEERNAEEKRKAEERKAEEKRKAEANRISKEKAKGPNENVRLAGDKLERAHEKLEIVKHPDAVTQGFGDELEVLAEMTLSLRLQCERVTDKPKEHHDAPAVRGMPDRLVQRIRRGRNTDG